MDVFDYHEYLEGRFRCVAERLARSDAAFDRERLRSVFLYACEAHEGQSRKSGEPYIIHPVETALIVAEMNLDPDSVAAAMLHDSIEDTKVTHQDIKSRFGQAVADLVDGVTKLTRVEYTSKEDQQMENLRKMFLAMARDIRVIMIKIGDRLHNMRTSEYWEEQKRREKSLETMNLYAPLAHRLGIQTVKWELEDLAFKNLDPVAFKEISDYLTEQEAHNEAFLNHIKSILTARLEEAGIQSAIEGRVKHIYSIYRKKYSQNKSLEEIYDLHAVRVIVETIADCYNVLGFVHDLFKPIPGRFKDYISTPKPNMYQSLHTTVIGREGVPFEAQIRTWDMHRTAEYGIAAHWQYKEGVSSDNRELNRKLAWVRSLLESQQDTDPEEFIKAIKVDMFADDVFVFTPRGDVINLPLGAGVIDFAYAIHSAVGNRMQGAKVNGKMVSLDYTLQNGDIIEVLTAGGSHGPSRDWLKMVKTNEARNKIKQWFKKERHEENVAEGKADFEKELKRTGISMQTINEVLQPALKRMSFSVIEDMYSAIGYGGLTVTRAINRFRDELVRLNKQRPVKVQIEKSRKPKKAVSGVIVEGLDNFLIKFSRCCLPVPGDDIVGFITRGYGVSIHRSDCVSALRMRQSEEKGRWVPVQWAEEIKQSYQTDLTVTAHDRASLLVDVMAALSAAKLPINTLHARTTGDNMSIIRLTAEVSGSEQIAALRNDLARVSGVTSVKRE
ncbi:MAG: bifunctional (p)ppGpp synthetase/guanosine-3',5'-bis(diphosphate) 3'-pyrophosphohydrolase [Oscillospiraceae bacterium]|nr:bifunctional (p)ppGpp synthetase/guanosine-3',5'-bis(diphosphate) 3'-pyrophosphohydrolase [Oscillospiraceae bacterium]